MSLGFVAYTHIIRVRQRYRLRYMCSLSVRGVIMCQLLRAKDSSGDESTGVCEFSRRLLPRTFSSKCVYIGDFSFAIYIDR